MKSRKVKRLDVQVPVSLYERLVYMSCLPSHQSWGGTLETLVIRALEEGSIGIAMAYERFEDKKLITDEVRRSAFGRYYKPKAKTKMVAGSKGKRRVPRRRAR